MEFSTYIYGNFHYQVDWKKGKDVITASKKYKVTVDGAVHTLTILDVSGEDISDYTAACRGKLSTAKLTLEGNGIFNCHSLCSGMNIYLEKNFVFL